MKKYYALILLLVGFCILAGCSSSNSAKKISQDEAYSKIYSELTKNGASTPDFELVEITPQDVWEKAQCQLFKIVDGSAWETYVLTSEKAYHIGAGFGGSGVVSVLPDDVNADGTCDLIYSYSWGSGLHRSEIAWFDMKAMEQYSVSDPIELQMIDIILKEEAGTIGVFEITGMDETMVSPDALRKYPTAKDIDAFSLNEIGALEIEDGELVLKKN